MNSVHFIGHVGQDPEFTTFQSGKQNARLTVAINNYRKDQEPIWVRCEFWEDAAERLKKCGVRKGTHISITGSLAANNWDKEIAGQKVNMKTLFARVQGFDVLTPKGTQTTEDEGTQMVAEK